jgi:carbon monoxide dehydrogenase subunit G
MAPARSLRCYRVVPLGLEVEPPGVVEVDPLGGVVVAGGVDGKVVDGGDADGVRSPGRSPTRSLPDSVQAVSNPRLSATAQKPVSILFMCGASSRGLHEHIRFATSMPPSGVLTGCETTITNAVDRHRRCGDPRRVHKGDVPMKLEGAYDVPAARQKVWEAFQDPQQLKQAIPGCEKLEAIGPDEYKATMKVGVGGVKGTFEGKVRLSDKHPPESYKMAVEGAGGPGFIRGETVITLTEAGGGTRVAYTADLQVGGLIASVGQRMLGGVSKMMADKFFNRMSELLQA